MRRSLLSCVFLSCAVFVAPAAFAGPQWGGGYGDQGGTLRCESRDNRTQRCATNGYDAELIRQLSDSPCTRNRTWGVDGYGIWVSGGCRAEFRLVRDDYYGGGGYGGGGYGGGYGDGDGRIVRCESRDTRQNYCNTGGGRVVLVRQISDSACIQGRTWDYDRRGVWVSGGCRADFRVDDRYGGGYGGGNGGGYGGGYGGSDLIRCESDNNRSRTCALPTGNSRRYSVRLIRQMSDTPCIEGQTWGQSANGIWVTRGCRGEFVVEPRRRGDSGRIWPRGDQRPPGDDYGPGPGQGNVGGDAQTLRCESDDQRTRRCDTRGARNVELIRQLSESPCVRGESWNWDRSGIWVSGGCRAEFRYW